MNRILNDGTVCVRVQKLGRPVKARSSERAVLEQNKHQQHDTGRMIASPVCFMLTVMQDTLQAVYDNQGAKNALPCIVKIAAILNVQKELRDIQRNRHKHQGMKKSSCFIASYAARKQKQHHISDIPAEIRQ
ncbi:MAG: hypothetical protein IJP92_06665 [Lachnospiraceae bacterium]|nr:hypothetical protein [Lachnospiraceae bacterium]